MSRRVLSWSVGAVGALAILGGLWLDTADRSQFDVSDIASVPQPLQEDDPGWNCAKDGNGRCGGDGFSFYDPNEGGKWMWCPAPLSGIDCHVPYRK